MHGSSSSPEVPRKQLARAVALAEWTLTHDRTADASRLERSRRVTEARAALAAYDDRHPADALVALDADGPRWNEPHYTRKRHELLVKIDGARRRPARDPAALLPRPKSKVAPGR